jgi:hypothetical protein
VLAPPAVALGGGRADGCRLAEDGRRPVIHRPGRRLCRVLDGDDLWRADGRLGGEHQGSRVRSRRHSHRGGNRRSATSGDAAGQRRRILVHPTRPEAVEAPGSCCHRGHPHIRPRRRMRSRACAAWLGGATSLFWPPLATSSTPARVSLTTTSWPADADLPRHTADGEAGSARSGSRARRVPRRR